MPVMDLIGDDATAAGPWSCPRCGRDNKASWRQCPGCESDRTGTLPTPATTARQPRQITVPGLVLGLLLLSVLVVAATVLAAPAWTWVVEQWETLTAWVDARL